MQELADPSLALDRARELWQKHGRSEKWIQQRMTGLPTRFSEEPEISGYPGIHHRKELNFQPVMNGDERR